MDALLCLSLEIHHLGMVQRRLKSEVWLRDVLNKQISVAENYAIFACVLLLSYLMLGHRIVSLFSQPDPPGRVWNTRRRFSRRGMEPRPSLH